MELIKGLFTKKPTPKPPAIRIAGIYVSASRLGLPKGWQTVERWPEGAPIIAAMESGKYGLYRYEGPESAANVDWVWHVFGFDRYATDEEASSLVRYV